MSAFLPVYWIRVLGGSEATGGQLVSRLFGSGVLGGLAGGCGVVCRSLWHTCHVHWNDRASLLGRFGRVGPAAKSQE